MAGRFEGVSELEWRLFEDVFPPAPPKRGRGMPHAPLECHPSLVAAVAGRWHAGRAASTHSSTTSLALWYIYFHKNFHRIPS